jgi:voltage-gated potassium channel
MPTLNSLFRTSNLGRFGALVGALLLTFTAAPFFRDETVGVSDISILYTIVMVVGAYAVSQNKGVFFTGMALAVPAVATEWISNFYPTPVWIIANMVLAGVFIIYVSGVVLYEVLDEDEVTLDTIAGGIAVYLLIGIGWVLAYAAIEHLYPGAFLIQGRTLYDVHPGEQVRYTEFLYFSFVTLTTLGYGDMIPTIPQARAAATGQAVVGQLYIAIFVARLVGLHLAHQHFSRHTDD